MVLLLSRLRGIDATGEVGGQNLNQLPVGEGPATAG
jgi:hypothetical protein